MLARTCNSIGKDSVPSKPAHHTQPHQQSGADKKDGSSTRLIKSTSPDKKSSLGVDGVTPHKDASSTSRQSTMTGGRGRSSSSPTSARVRPDTRRGDGSRWGPVSDGGRPPSGDGSPASTTRTADSDRDSVDDIHLQCTATDRRHHDRRPARQTVTPYSSSHAPPPPPPGLGLYESLRLQQEAAALQAAVYSPLHQLLAQRHLSDPLAMYSASLQAAAVVAAAANLSATGKDYRLGSVPRPCGVDSADLISNGDVDGGVFSAAGMLPLRPPVAHQQLPFTCSWLTGGGEFCAQRFSTSDELFSHLRTHVDGAATSDDPLRSVLPPAPTVSGLLCPGQSASLPVAGTFGVVSPAASLAAAHAAASFYGNKAHRSGRSSRDTASASPTSATDPAVGGSVLHHAAAAAAAAASSRYHPYKWTPSPLVASQLAGAFGTGGGGLPISDLTPPSALSAFLQQPSYAGLFSAHALGAAVP